SCANQGGNGLLQVQASGPSNSVADGTQVDGGGAIVYSVTGSTMELGNDLQATNGAGYNNVDLDLYSPTAGGAHISLFKYIQGPGNASGFRCKISGTGYATS